MQKRKGACCAGQDIYDAKRVAEAIGIPHYVLDYESRFRKNVIEDFADAYARGETPIPCVRCNEKVKFADLMTRRASWGPKRWPPVIMSAASKGRMGLSCTRRGTRRAIKAIFFSPPPRAQLDYLRFPLGDMEKSAVRALAAELELATAAKPDSQDICFVPEGRYTAIVEKLRPDAARPGEIVDQAGAVLGRHDGIIHFTVGQRKGLGCRAMTSRSSC